jgi:hypothetical protein
MKLLGQKSLISFVVVFFTALAAFADKPALVSDLSDFDSFNNALTMRYLEAANPVAFNSLALVISPKDQTDSGLERVRKYHIGVQRTTNTLIVFKRQSKIIMATIPVTSQTVAQLENSLVIVNKLGKPDLSDDDEGTAKGVNWTDMVSGDLTAYADSQSAIPEYLPLGAHKRNFGIEQKVEGGSVSFEAGQTIYNDSTRTPSMQQKASLFLKRSINDHTDANFEIRHTIGGPTADDNTAMFYLKIHGN